MGATKEDVAELNMGDGLTDLPPGFRFHPTDEEIITHYLSEKVVNRNFSPRAIGEEDLNRCEPWDLPSKAKMGEKEWYFFCRRDRKYPTGMRTNRATDAGYWKATGKDKEIYKRRNCLVGLKKTLVFYMGRAPKGVKTNWVMHEYRLEGKSLYYNPQRSAKDEWVVCRVFHKNTGLKTVASPHETVRIDSFGMNLGFINECLESPPLPSLLEPPLCNSSRPSSSFIDVGDGGDIKGIATAVSDPSPSPSAFPTQNDHQDRQKCFITNIAYSGQLNPCDPQQGCMFYPPSASMTPYRSLPMSSNACYFHQERNSGLASDQTAAHALRGHSKLEQYYCTNQSLVSASQGTDLSTDRNTETSSAMSKHDVAFRSYDDHDGPEASYLANLWEY